MAATNGNAGGGGAGAGGGGAGDDNSILQLALQNPSLSKAASVLLRTMQETGTISADDAALMSSFLTSCDIPQSGHGEAPRAAGNKRARTGDGAGATSCGGGVKFGRFDSADLEPFPIGKGGGLGDPFAIGGNDHEDDGNEIQAAAAARTVTAQIPESEWEPNPIKKVSASASQEQHPPPQPQPQLQLQPIVTPLPRPPMQMPPAPVAVSAAVSSTQTPGAVATSTSTIESVRSEYTHEKCVSDPASCVACPTLDNPLNMTPVDGRESHTSDLDAFDRYIQVLQHAQRPPTIGPFSAEFWSHIRTILEAAVPVGFEALPDKNAVSPKGPADCAKFLAKVVGTSSINPIHPNIIAEASNLSLGTVLNELFCATRLGLVNMQWAPLCERCGSMACAKTRIEDLQNSAYCSGCQYENTVDCLEKIKVIFTLNRDVFYVLMENFACTPSKASMAATCMFAVIPATSTGSGFRYSVGCGGDLMFCPALKPGRYRMHCPVAKTDNYLFVRREATDDDEPCQVKLAVSDMVVKPGDQLKTFYADTGKLHFDIFPDTRSFLVLWVQKDLDDHTLKYLPPEERPAFTSAKDVIEFPTFQVLFQKEVEQMLLAAMQQMKQKSYNNADNHQFMGGKKSFQ